MINLQKGQKQLVGSKNFTVGLGWDALNNGDKIDLDVSVFMLNQNKIIPTEKHFVFYGNLKSMCHSIIHNGDCRTGETSDAGDDETIVIDVTKIPQDIKELIFVVTIDDAENLRQNFGMVRNSYIRIVDNTTNEEILKYTLDEDFSIETGVIFGRLYLLNDEWKFSAEGLGYKEDLGYFVSQYYQGPVVK